MKKKVISIFIGILMLISNMNVLAANIKYTPGARTQKLIFEEAIALTDAEASSQNLVIKAGGKAEFEYIQQFDAKSATVKYTASEEVNLTIATERGENVRTLFPDSTEVTISLNPELRRSVQKVCVSADKDITISSVTFNKIDYYEVSDSNKCIVEYPEYMDAVQGTVAVFVNANAIKVNGAMRYIDYNDKKETPIVEAGRIYLPVKTLARAFGLYFEDYTDLGYVYLSNDIFELYTTPKESYIMIYSVKTNIDRPVIYKNGEAFMPVRLVAEALGESVGYRDGIAVIDNKISMKNVLTDEAVFKELKNEFSEYDVSKAVEGNTYHVSKADYASDTNNGSENFPFATISKAAEIAKAGDTVIIHEGVYYEEVIPKNDGTPTSPIIFKAAEGENVQLSAMEEVSDFRRYKDNIWCAVVPKSFGAGHDFVTIKGVAVNEGRHPNSDTHPVAKVYNTDDPDYDRSMYSTAGDLIVTKDKVDMSRENYDKANNPDVEDIEISSRVDLNQDEKDYWKGAHVIALHSKAWTLSAGEVTASEKGKITVKDLCLGAYGFTYYNSYPYETDFGYLTNHLNTVDMPGEWYIDKSSNVMYMIPPDGTKGEDLTIELKQRQRVIDLRNRKCIRFENINTYGGGITMKDSELCVLNGGKHKYISHFTYSTSPHTGAYDTSVEDPDWAPGRGEAGEYISGKNNAIINTEINGSAGAGIYMAGLYNYIDNNKVLNTSYGGIYPSGITIEGERWKDNVTSPRGGHTITGNTSKYAGRAVYYNSQNFRSDDASLGKVVYPSIASEVAFNEFGYGCVMSRDGGVTYEHGTTEGTDLMMTQFHHNIIYDHVGQRASELEDMSMLVYRDNHTAMQELYSNIVFNSTDDPEREGKIPKSRMLFRQKMSNGSAYTEDYNNKVFMHYPDGIENFEIEHFPNAKPFRAGVEGQYDRMMDNYEKKSLNKVIYVNDVKLDNGAFIDEDGIGHIKEPKSGFTLENVDLSTHQKKLTLYCTGDRFKKFNLPSSGESFNVDLINLMYEVIQDGKTVYSGDSIMLGGGTEIYDITEYNFYIPENIKGRADIRIYTNAGSDYGFVKFMLSDSDDVIPEGEYPEGAYSKPAGYTAEVINPPSNTTPLRYEININATTALSLYSLCDTWDRTIRYDFTTETDIDTFRMKIGTGRKYSYGTITLYLDSLDSEPLGVIDVEKSYNEQFGSDYTGWTTFEKQEIKFKDYVPAGTHSYYLVFEGNGKGQFCVDFHNLAIFDSKLVSNTEG